MAGIWYAALQAPAKKNVKGVEKGESGYYAEEMNALIKGKDEMDRGVTVADLCPVDDVDRSRCEDREAIQQLVRKLELRLRGRQRHVFHALAAVGERDYATMAAFMDARWGIRMTWKQIDNALSRIRLNVTRILPLVRENFPAIQGIPRPSRRAA